MKVVVSSWGHEYPSMPGVRANDDQVWALSVRGAVRQGVLAACAPRRARGPANAHVGPMICTWAAPPTRTSSGLRAYQGVNAHIQRFARELHTRPGTVVSKTQPASAATPRCQCFSPRWSAIWAPHRPEPRHHHRPTGGICTIRGATRRRHAEGRLLMLQTPTITPGVIFPH